MTDDIIELKAQVSYYKSIAGAFARELSNYREVIFHTWSEISPIAREFHRQRVESGV